MVKVLCIIQARLTSSRLPNKVFAKLDGSNKTVLEHVYNRLSLSKFIDRVVFAIPDTPLNEPLERFLSENGFVYNKGSEDDVLDRFYKTAEPYSPKIIVRATCDNPCVDWVMADEMISKFEGFDYSYPEDCPLGVGVELISFKALNAAYNEATRNYQREHVCPFIYEQPNRFNVKKDKYIFDAGIASKARLTMDESSDYALINRIYKDLYKGAEIPNMDIYNYLSSNPYLMSINSSVHQKGENE